MAHENKKSHSVAHASIKQVAWPPGAVDTVCPTRCNNETFQAFIADMAVDTACSNRLPSLRFVYRRTLSVSSLISLVILTFDLKPDARYCLWCGQVATIPLIWCFWDFSFPISWVNNCQMDRVTLRP